MASSSRPAASAMRPRFPLAVATANGRPSERTASLGLPQEGRRPSSSPRSAASAPSCTVAIATPLGSRTRRKRSRAAVASSSARDQPPARISRCPRSRPADPSTTSSCTDSASARTASSSVRAGSKSSRAIRWRAIERRGVASRPMATIACRPASSRRLSLATASRSRSTTSGSSRRRATSARAVATTVRTGPSPGWGCASRSRAAVASSAARVSSTGPRSARAARVSARPRTERWGSPRRPAYAASPESADTSARIRACNSRARSGAWVAVSASRSERSARASSGSAERPVRLRGPQPSPRQAGVGAAGEPRPPGGRVERPRPAGPWSWRGRRPCRARRRRPRRRVLTAPGVEHGSPRRPPPRRAAHGSYAAPWGTRAQDCAGEQRVCEPEQARPPRPPSGAARPSCRSRRGRRRRPPLPGRRATARASRRAPPRRGTPDGAVAGRRPGSPPGVPARQALDHARVCRWEASSSAAHIGLPPLASCASRTTAVERSRARERARRSVSSRVRGLGVSSVTSPSRPVRTPAAAPPFLGRG